MINSEILNMRNKMKDNIINLRSDTFTTPSYEMRKVMQQAEVGDDYYDEDPSAIKLQEYCKELFQVEDALFMTSGMLSNRLAVMSQTSAGDEIITEHNYHLNLFESGPTAALARVVINTVKTIDGIIRVEDIKCAINAKPREDFYSSVTLVSLENTINSYQGKIYPINEIEFVSAYCRDKGISLHLDGARLFNAHVATGIPLHIYASYVDTLSVCFSKGLGSPFGSMLMGKKDIIKKAKRLRVWLGSGFHQIGIYAEAARFALSSQLERLKIDHRLTKQLAEKLMLISNLNVDVNNIETNMIFLDISKFNISADEFVERCKSNGLLLCSWLPSLIRIVVHRDITEEMIQTSYEIIRSVASDLTYRE